MLNEVTIKHEPTKGKKGCLPIMVSAILVLFFFILMSAIMTSCRSTKDNLKTQVNTERATKNKVEDKSQIDVDEKIKQVLNESASTTEQIKKEHSSEINLNVHSIKYRDDGSISEETFVNLNNTNNDKELSGKQTETNKVDSLSVEETDNSKLNIKEELSETLKTKDKVEVTKEKKESNIPLKISLCIVAFIISLIVVLKLINAVKSMGWSELWKKTTK